MHSKLVLQLQSRGLHIKSDQSSKTKINYINQKKAANCDDGQMSSEDN